MSHRHSDSRESNPERIKEKDLSPVMRAKMDKAVAAAIGYVQELITKDQQRQPQARGETNAGVNAEDHTETLLEEHD